MFRPTSNTPIPLPARIKYMVGRRPSCQKYFFTGETFAARGIYYLVVVGRLAANVVATPHRAERFRD